MYADCAAINWARDEISEQVVRLKRGIIKHYNLHVALQKLDELPTEVGDERKEKGSTSKELCSSIAF